MGFLNKLMGMGTTKSDAKKEEIRQIFNAKVENGESYIVFAGMNMVTKQTILKETRTFYNYIVGYKDGDDPEIVIIETTHDLASFNEPIYCKKSECTRASYDNLFNIWNPHLGDEPVKFMIIASSAWGGYVISASYVDEFAPFLEFFQKRFEKRRMPGGVPQAVPP